MVICDGGAQVIPASWLRLFNQVEVNELLSGGALGGADLEDMRAHSLYSGGYSPDSRTVKHFWQVAPPPTDGPNPLPGRHQMLYTLCRPATFLNPKNADP